MRSLIEDIKDVRFHKVETSLESFEDARSSAVKVCFSFIVHLDVLIGSTEKFQSTGTCKIYDLKSSY